MEDAFGWRSNSFDGCSAREEEVKDDDEEDLIWAALEQLPIYNCLKKGILISSSGEAHVVDVNSLGLNERQRLIDKLVKVAEVDNEQFLLKLKNRFDRVGIELPKVEVQYEHLNVEAEAFLASKALPSFTKFYQHH